jgi:hypothetical protein
MEPREPGYSIFKGAKPEPKIVYELPDGTTTIWLSEYIDAMVEQERQRIIELLEAKMPGAERVGAFYASAIQDAIDLIKEER